MGIQVPVVDQQIRKRNKIFNQFDLPPNIAEDDIIKIVQGQEKDEDHEEDDDKKLNNNQYNELIKTCKMLEELLMKK